MLTGITSIDYDLWIHPGMFHILLRYCTHLQVWIPPKLHLFLSVQLDTHFPPGRVDAYHSGSTYWIYWALDSGYSWKGVSLYLHHSFYMYLHHLYICPIEPEHSSHQPPPSTPYQVTLLDPPPPNTALVQYRDWSGFSWLTREGEALNQKQY